MTIEIKVQNDERTVYDSVMLTQEMLLELIDNNPAKLKQIISDMSKKIPGKTATVKIKHNDADNKKGMSYLMAAAVKFTT